MLVPFTFRMESPRRNFHVNGNNPMFFGVPVWIIPGYEVGSAATKLPTRLIFLKGVEMLVC